MIQDIKMDIFSYPISRHVRAKLQASNFITLNDFRGISAENLSSKTGLPNAEAKELLGLLGVTDDEGNDQPFPSLTAAELLVQSKKKVPITTSSKKIDDMLGGGIPLSKLTEICGIPGSGKTQLCLQLALNAQIHTSVGGLRGEVLYIDTEGSFSSQRLADMAKAANVTGASIDQIIRGIHYHRCLDCSSLLDVINTLHDFMSSHDKVRLVVIDNIAYHIRIAFDSKYKLRMRTMHNMVQILAALAQKHSIAVVLTNQMTTRIDKDGQAVVVPSLGDSWRYACCNRIILSFADKVRLATLVKSSYRPFSTASFEIQTAGIRDVPAQEDNHPSSSATSQFGFYENSIGTSELAANDECGVQDDNSPILGAVAKRPRLNS